MNITRSIHGVPYQTGLPEPTEPNPMTEAAKRLCEEAHQCSHVGHFDDPKAQRCRRCGCEHAVTTQPPEAV